MILLDHVEGLWIKDKSGLQFSEVELSKHGGLPARASVCLLVLTPDSSPSFHTELLDSSL